MLSELHLLPLGNWEGGVSDETESEELPRFQRVTGTGSMKLGMAFLFCGKVFYFRGDNIEK